MLIPLTKKFIMCFVSNGNVNSFWLVGFGFPNIFYCFGWAKNAWHSHKKLSGWRFPSCRTLSFILLSMRNKLLATLLPSNRLDMDSFSWFIEGSSHNDFSSNLTWEQLRPREHSLPWTKLVWFKICISKHAFTFWVMHQDRLPVRFCLAD